MEQIELTISGMTCRHCEQALERAALALEGVASAKGDYVKNTLEVRFTGPCTRARLVKAVRDAGYDVEEAPVRRRDGVGILVILVGLFLIARRLGLGDLFRLFPEVGEEQIGYAALFVVGLFTSVHCVAMCGGINLTQSVAGEERRPLGNSLLYNLGRLVSYTLTGGLLGLLGEAVAVSLEVRGLIGLIAGGVMVLMGVNMLGQFQLLRRLAPRLPNGAAVALAKLARQGPFAIGLVNGLMPCGPLQSMQLYAVASGGPLTGALSMMAFCLGTIPLILVLGLAAGALRRSWKRRMLQCSAGLLVLFGLFMVQNNLALSGISLPALKAGDSGGAAVAVVEDGVQYITTELQPNGYADIQVEAGIPVVWTMVAEESSLNGCNREIILSDFDQRIKLEAGENVISFLPEEAGTYTYSCWMGMLHNTITVTE